MSSIESLHRELRNARSEINRLKQTVAKVSELCQHLVSVTATEGQPPEVADMVRCHNQALDELLLLMLEADNQPKIVVYGNESEPCMAIDAATIEIHDEY